MLCRGVKSDTANGTDHLWKRIWEHGFLLSTCVGQETEFASKWEMSVLRADVVVFVCFILLARGIYLALLFARGCVGLC